MLHLHRNWINTEVYVTLNQVSKVGRFSLEFPRHRRNLKTEVSVWKLMKCLSTTLHWRNLKSHQSAAILDLCLRKDHIIYRKVVVFKVFSVRTKTQSRRFQIPPVWKAVSKSSVIRLVWTKDAFSSPETTILLACGRDRGLWSGPTPEVWQIWLV